MKLSIFVYLEASCSDLPSWGQLGALTCFTTLTALTFLTHLTTHDTITTLFGRLGDVLSSFEAHKLGRASRSNAKTGLCWGSKTVILRGRWAKNGKLAMSAPLLHNIFLS